MRDRLTAYRVFWRTICQYRLSCIHLKCPFIAKMDISIGNSKDRSKE
ncbi:hypothetical protein GZ807_004267 [Escherichia coli]|nr:hypothetical protein [Escherichia coli]